MLDPRSKIILPKGYPLIFKTLPGVFAFPRPLCYISDSPKLPFKNPIPAFFPRSSFEKAFDQARLHSGVTFFSNCVFAETLGNTTKLYRADEKVAFLAFRAGYCRKNVHDALNPVLRT